MSGIFECKLDISHAQFEDTSARSAGVFVSSQQGGGEAGKALSLNGAQEGILVSEMTVGSSNADAGDACRVFATETLDSMLINQAKRSGDQDCAQIAMMIGVLGIACGGS